MGSHNKKATDVGIALLADPPEPILFSDEFCRGTRPSQAASCRPDLNREASVTVATIALAVIGPIPGIVSRRRLNSCEQCQM